MSGIPEDEVQIYVDHDHQQMQSLISRQALHDAIRWAEGFRWDARETQPNHREWYHVWSPDVARWVDMQAAVSEEDGQVFWIKDNLICSAQDRPHYKPMPPAPEDD